MKLTPQLSQAIVNLREHPDFQVFLSALADDAESLVEKLVMMPTDHEVDVVRGQARQLSLVLKAVAEAPQTLKMHKENAQRSPQRVN